MNASHYTYAGTPSITLDLDPPMRLPSRRVLLACQMSVSVALLAGLIYVADPKSLLQTFGEIAPTAFALAFAVLALAHMLGAYRMHLALGAFGVAVSLKDAIALTWLGL